MTELFSAQAAEGDTLERALSRTQEFLTLVQQEIVALGRDPLAEKYLKLASGIMQKIDNVEDHYTLREVMANALTSSAYRALAEKWSAR